MFGRSPRLLLFDISNDVNNHWTRSSRWVMDGPLSTVQDIQCSVTPQCEQKKVDFRQNANKPLFSCSFLPRSASRCQCVRVMPSSPTRNTKNTQLSCCVTLFWMDVSRCGDTNETDFIYGFCSSLWLMILLLRPMSLITWCLLSCPSLLLSSSSLRARPARELFSSSWLRRSSSSLRCLPHKQKEEHWEVEPKQSFWHLVYR